MKDLESLVPYNLRDCELLIDIDDSIGVFKDILANSALTRSPWTNMSKNATASMMSCMYAYNCMLAGKAIFSGTGSKSYESTTAKFKGAFVMTPVCKMYVDWVLCYDIASLYPSIMRALNIGNVTCKTFNNYTNCPGFMGSPDKHVAPIIGKPYKIKAKNGNVAWAVVVNEEGRTVLCISKETKKSMLSSLLETLLSERKCYKILMKERAEEILNCNIGEVDKDPVYIEYKVAQEALKTQANSVYGALASIGSWICNHSLAELVTAVGRFVTSSAIKFFRSRSIKVIYADTDSIILVAHSGQPFESFYRTCSDLIEKFEKDLKENSSLDTIKFEHEWSSKPTYYKKKKYAKYVWTHNGSMEPIKIQKMDIVGLSVIRKNFPRICSKICSTLYVPSSPAFAKPLPRSTR